MYKDNKTFDERFKESEMILKKYPNRIPVIVEKSKKCKNIVDIDKNKFLVPNDMVMSQFIYVIRKRIKLSSEKAIFIFVNNNIVPNSTPLAQVYFDNKDKDNFLYVTYSGENTFG